MTEFGAQNSSSAASNKNFVDELLVTLNALKSDIERSKGNSAKQGKCMNNTETEENQGIHIQVFIPVYFCYGFTFCIACRNSS